MTLLGVSYMLCAASSVSRASPVTGTNMTFQTIALALTAATAHPPLPVTFPNNPTVEIVPPRQHFDEYLIRPKVARSKFLQGLQESGTEITDLLSTPETPEILTPRNLGIDLDARGHEIKKIFCAGFGAQVRREGFDLDDVLQEVYKKIMVSNRGRSPYDPERSSFGTFVHRVAASAFFNYREREFRYRGRYRTGISGYRDHGGYGVWDVAEMDHPDEEEGYDRSEFFHDLSRISEDLSEEESEVWRLAATGHKFREIRKASDLNSRQVRETLNDLKERLIERRGSEQVGV